MVMPNFKLGRRTAKTRTLDECPNRPKTPDIFLPWPFAIIVPVTAVQSSSRYRCSWHALLVPLRMCPNFRQPRANIHPKAEFSLPCIANTQHGNGKSTIYTCYFPIRTSIHRGIFHCHVSLREGVIKKSVGSPAHKKLMSSRLDLCTGGCRVL